VDEENSPRKRLAGDRKSGYLTMMEIHLRLHGERALFRNLAMPGADVATEKVRNNAILGLLGNIMGKWRNFDDREDFSLTSDLKAWIENHSLTIRSIEYPKDPQIVLLGQHRYKGIKDFTKRGESGPATLTYHWNIQIDVKLKLDKSGGEELIGFLRQPRGTPYLGQSNCLAQIELVSKELIG